MMPRGVREPWLDRSRKAANQRQTIYAEVDELLGERIDMPAGKPQELNRNGVVGQRMLDDVRREGGEILWRCARHPMHNRVRIRSKFCKKRTQQCRPRRASIMGPQCAAQRLDAKPTTASFTRNRPTPAPDLIRSAFQPRPADATGADHDDAAIPPAMCADACRLGIGDENRHAIGMLVLSRSLKLAGFAG